MILLYVNSWHHLPFPMLSLTVLSPRCSLSDNFCCILESPCFLGRFWKYFLQVITEHKCTTILPRLFLFHYVLHLLLRYSCQLLPSKQPSPVRTLLPSEYFTSRKAIVFLFGLRTGDLQESYVFVFILPLCIAVQWPRMHNMYGCPCYLILNHIKHYAMCRKLMLSATLHQEYLLNFRSNSAPLCAIRVTSCRIRFSTT